MTSGQHHVVFGAGQVGRTLAARLAEATDTPCGSSRSTNRPVFRPGSSRPRRMWSIRMLRHKQRRWCGALSMSERSIQQVARTVSAAAGRGVLAAAERTGALLVTLENLYGYGPTGGGPITEDLPLAADTVKGRTRAAMSRELLAAADAGRVRIAIGRASDFFGPGVTGLGTR